MDSSRSPTDQHSLRVAIVSTQQHWHGGEAQAALLAKGLRARRHRCFILARGDGEFAFRMRQLDFEVFGFPQRGRSPRAIWQIRSVLARMSPDIVHANDAHGLTAAGLAGVGLHIPARVAARRVDFPLRWTGRYRAFADGILCVSTAVQRVCREAGLSDRLLHVVPDGVEPAFAASGQRDRGRHSLQLTDDHTLLLTIAKLTDHKGHAYLLRALPELVSRYPKLVVALAGDGELRGELEGLVKQLGISRSVRFLGYRQDVPDLLAAADLVVQPSHMEGLCSSLIDAMLAARPIVATTAGGIPDLLRVPPGQPAVAWLVPPRSPSQLAAAISAAVEGATTSVDRGRRARQRALELFTADAMVENTLAAYQRILELRCGSQAASSWRSMLPSTPPSLSDRSVA